MGRGLLWSSDYNWMLTQRPPCVEPSRGVIIDKMVDSHFLEGGFSGMHYLPFGASAESPVVDTGWVFPSLHYYIVTPTYITVGREALVPLACFSPRMNSNSCVWHVCREARSLPHSTICSGPCVLRVPVTLTLQSWPTLHPFIKLAVALRMQSSWLDTWSLVPTFTQGSYNCPWPSGLS